MLDLRKGNQLANRYTLQRPLGGGGEADVWLARDRLTDALVALKVSVATQRLRDEWQMGIRLMHAHIVRAFEFHEEKEFSFFSQQYIEGGDIGSLAGQSAEQIFAPLGLVAAALSYMHGKGVVHRDIKSSNILLDGNGAPYLVDFGIAGIVGDEAAGRTSVASSPQSLAGESAQTADDIFAFGGVIYELLTGSCAYAPDNVADDILNAVPPPVRQCNGEALTGDITALIAEMLHKDAAERPTAGDVAERLLAAGYAPGVATGTSVTPVADRQRADEQIVATARRRAEVPQPGSEVAPGADAGRRDFGRVGVGVALIALLSVLIGVVFFLPDQVDEQVADSAATDESLQSTDDVAAREARDNLRSLEGEEITFSENSADLSGLGNEELQRLDVEVALGELLSALQVLEGRAADRWAPAEYRQSRELYAAGDKAYLDKEFAQSKQRYEEALEVLQPLYARIEPTFRKAFTDAEEAFAAGNRLEALQYYELAVAITPSHPGAVAGYERAKNLEAVLSLVEQGTDFENDLDLVAAERSFSQAVEKDSLWQPATDGLQRVRALRTKMEFDLRMSDGFAALAGGDYLAARAAFRVAQKLIPGSGEPADGLLQVEQGLRLSEIQTLEQEALALEKDEHWDAVVRTYEEILKVDATLAFASDGLANAKSMSALHAQLDALIAEPDKLSAPQQMQRATQLVVSITTRPDVGPRLGGQRDELSRLLRRAATPLTVPLLSDNVTEVTIYRVGQLGQFMRTEVSLRPGNYVAVGVRPGYRDVRQEFRVAPEVTIEPVVVRCEERI